MFHPRWKHIALLLGLLAAAGALMLFASAARTDPSRVQKLEDGSRIALGPGGALTLARIEKDEVRLVLERGNATFDVIRDADRRFVVAVADVDFVVAGARFVDGSAGKL